MGKFKKLCAIVMVLIMAFSVTSQSVFAAKKVKLNKTKATVYVGKSVQLKVNNNKKKVKWSTSNKKVAIVSKKGKVTGKKAGKATITAKIGKKKYKCKITVKKKATKPSKPSKKEIVGKLKLNSSDAVVIKRIIKEQKSRGNTFIEDDLANSTFDKAGYLTGLDIRVWGNIDLTGLNHLEDLSIISGDRITGLIVKNNLKLKSLSIVASESAKIESLDVSNNKNLEKLYLVDCEKLNDIDVSSNKNLKFLTLYDCINLRKGIDVTHNINLEELDCSYSNITSLDISKNSKLRRLDCSDNKLSSLDVSKNNKLEELDCSTNKLESIDVLNNINLVSLDAGGNKLKSIDVSRNTSLTKLRLDGNNLKSVDLSKNTSLEVLDVGLNELTSLDVSNLTKLKRLGVGNWGRFDTIYYPYNTISTLDVSKNVLLETLSVDNLQLTKLDVSKNTLLWSLSCARNKFTTLNLTSNKKLISLWCDSNVAITGYTGSVNGH